ncbi:chemotaxis protein CheV [bacterium]|nr:chemotaxis protein CheV [bacterium]
MSYKGEILLDAGTNELEVVEFMLHSPTASDAGAMGYFGINVAKVKEIVTMPVPLEIPMTHPAVAGAMSLRGQVITLIDLAKWLGLPSTITKKTRVIVTEFNGAVTGFIVSSVSRIHRISWSQVVPPPSTASMGMSDSLTAVVKLDERVLLLLDFEAILAELNPNISLSARAGSIKSAEEREGRLILIAEDSGAIRRIIVNSLKTAGYEVVACENGEEAWNWLNDRVGAGEPLPDLLISDIEMPQIDGLHLLSRIKATDGLKQLPVVMFSSLGNDSNREKAIKLGAKDLILKPDLPHLVELVDATVLDTVLA